MAKEKTYSKTHKNKFALLKHKKKVEQRGGKTTVASTSAGSKLLYKF